MTINECTIAGIRFSIAGIIDGEPVFGRWGH
jgi:hypothetical protein